MLNIDNLTYSIGQVSEITEVAQSTLRYWETVIERLKPQTTPGGSRRYNREDIELISIIKDLLYKQGYTIKGANHFLRTQKVYQAVDPDQDIQKNKEAEPSSSSTLSLDPEMLIAELEEIKKILK